MTYPESRASMEQAENNEEPIPFIELVRREAAAAAREEFEKNKAGFQDQVVGYARDVGIGAMTGQGTPNALPDITVTTTTGKKLATASARDRSFRTLLQGLGIDVGFALLSVLALAFTDFDFLDGMAWVTLGVLVIKTVIQTAVSYAMRLKFTPNYDKPLEALPDSLPGEQIAA